MKFEFYREDTKPHDWRWRLWSGGKKVANPGEGYGRLPAMVRTLQSIFGDSPKRSAELAKCYSRVKLDIAKGYYKPSNPASVVPAKLDIATADLAIPKLLTNSILR